MTPPAESWRERNARRAHPAAAALAADAALRIRMRVERRRAGPALGLVLAVAAVTLIGAGIAACPTGRTMMEAADGRRNPAGLLLIVGGVALVFAALLLIEGVVGVLRLYDLSRDARIEPTTPLVRLHQARVPSTSPDDAFAMGARLSAGDPRSLCEPFDAPPIAAASRGDTHVELWCRRDRSIAYVGIAHVDPDGTTRTLPSIVLRGEWMGAVDLAVRRRFELGRFLPGELPGLAARFGPDPRVDAFAAKHPSGTSRWSWSR